ncbi:MAG: hypothetical protein ACOYM3_04655 [Terrimicrobiaceae bacterium]
MSVLGKMQEDVKMLLEGSGLLPELPVIVRERGEILNDLEARLAALAICVYVMPVLPGDPLPGATFLFFSSAEVRVRVIENRKINSTGHDVYEVAEAVCLALQGKNPGDILSAPLEVTDFELNENAAGPSLDCIFHAAFGIEP